MARHEAGHGNWLFSWDRGLPPPDRGRHLKTLLVMVNLFTLRSTVSFKLFYGRHLLKSASSTQTVVALSSAESEFYAAVRATSVGIGAVAMLKDLI